jgi:hypothetical protein
VSHEHAERTPLATAICIYEIVILLLGLLPVALQWLNHYILATSHATHPSIPHHATPLLQTASAWLIRVLAVAGAIMLWRMHRSAFYLLASRFVLSLILFVTVWLQAPHLLSSLALPHAQLARLMIFGEVIRGIGIFFLILNALIAWVVYRITSFRNLSLPSPEIASPA